jgi:ribosomal protein L14E/L6E/L27E
MRNKIVILTLSVLTVCVVTFLLGFHLLISENGPVLLPKSQLSFRDSVVDIRHWVLEDFLKHSNRVNQYVLVHHYYQPIKQKATQRMDEAQKMTKETVSTWEKDFHRWFTEKMENQ